MKITLLNWNRCSVCIPAETKMKVEQGKQTAYVTAALKADYSRVRGPKSGSESGRTELKAKILTLGIAVVVTLYTTVHL